MLTDIIRYGNPAPKAESLDLFCQAGLDSEFKDFIFALSWLRRVDIHRLDTIEAEYLLRHEDPLRIDFSYRLGVQRGRCIGGYSAAPLCIGG